MAMICVTIGRGRHKSLHEEWKAAADAGAELVELRVDCLRREPDLKRILAERPTPLVFTIRKSADGGLWRGDEEKRQRLLREAIVAGVDYVDLEANVADSIRRFGKTQRIVSHHDLKEIPEDLPDLARTLRDKDADIVKIAAVAHSVQDAARMLEMVKDADGTDHRHRHGHAGRLHPHPGGEVRVTRSPSPGSTPTAPSPPACSASRSCGATTLTNGSAPRRRSSPSSATRSATASARRSTTPPTRRWTSTR